MSGTTDGRIPGYDKHGYLLAEFEQGESKVTTWFRYSHYVAMALICLAIVAIGVAGLVEVAIWGELR